jgi:sulfoxide reductase heme-binding subunit YedZ
MQSKLEQWEPAIADGIFVWLIGYRLLAAKFAVRGRLGLGWVAGLGVVATVLTGLGEALYFRLAFGVDPLRVLEADFSLQTGVRPAAVVLAFAVIVTVAGALRTRLVPPPKGRAHYA